MNDSFSSTIFDTSSCIQSKGYTRLNAGRKGEFLQDGCRQFAWKFYFQVQQQGHDQAEEPLNAYAVVPLMPSNL
ncbi:hypothetical protein TNCV_3992311 [Trichonephila clavipes]|uniref:Uncharacterized protein n=1 Tax=Trichonephila clavipes TaxID=2585209 RepID=A0A8X6VJL9_TRICX|nr:hypothetical protein TNCV_3992311 [Trichonephila clavipes]